MDDTPYLNDGADASLRKTVSLLNKIEANTSSAGGGGLTDTELRASPVSATVPIPGWSIPTHDYRSFGYTSGNLTSITYKTGGAGGTTVATLTLGYDGSGNLVSMTKT